MGKTKKIKNALAAKHLTLEEQINFDSYARPTHRHKEKKQKNEDIQFVDANLSRKILNQARKQQEDLEEEFATASGPNLSKSTEIRKKDASSKCVNLGDPEEEHESDGGDSDVGNDDFYEEIEINDEDERALQMFMCEEPVQRRTIADIIMEKLAEKQTEINTHLSDGGSVVNINELDPRVVEMYKGVRQVLSRYRSGKLPKAFKIIPSLSNWEQVLYLTEPDNWSAAAMYQATRIFASNLKEKMAQRFYNLVLFPRIRDDIAEYKKLNFHLYQALRKSLFKPGAFFKGIILPLCESKSCTLREAIIISSIMANSSIPVLHSSAAILKMAEMEYMGANSIFMRVLLDKKYALPYRVVDAVVYHFLGFRTEKRELPVLWHQCFLTFVQRYKEDISSEQKEELLEILKIHVHHQITPEIRRELQQSKSRDVQIKEPQVEMMV